MFCGGTDRRRETKNTMAQDFRPSWSHAKTERKKGEVLLNKPNGRSPSEKSLKGVGKNRSRAAGIEGRGVKNRRGRTRYASREE